jgi:hypothetical protein
VPCEELSGKENKIIFLGGEKPGLVVRAEDKRPRGRGFESRRILDGSKRFDSYYIKEKIENKGSQMGHTKKIFKKKENKFLFHQFPYFFVWSYGGSA